jgi:hypothetical protein
MPAWKSIPSRKDFGERKNVSHLHEYKEDLAALRGNQHPFNASQWEADMKTLASGADKIPVSSSYMGV